MTLYRDYEAQQQAALRAPKNDPIACKGCGCEWFEQIRVSKIDMNTLASPGQTVPELGYTHVLIRCVRCNDLQELPINLSSAGINPMVDSYTQMVDALQDKKEKK